MDLDLAARISSTFVLLGFDERSIPTFIAILGRDHMLEICNGLVSARRQPACSLASCASLSKLGFVTFLLLELRLWSRF